MYQTLHNIKRNTRHEYEATDSMLNATPASCSVPQESDDFRQSVQSYITKLYCEVQRGGNTNTSLPCSDNDTISSVPSPKKRRRQKIFSMKTANRVVDVRRALAEGGNGGGGGGGGGSCGNTTPTYTSVCHRVCGVSKASDSKVGNNVQGKPKESNGPTSPYSLPSAHTVPVEDKGEEVAEAVQEIKGSVKKRGGGGGGGGGGGVVLPGMGMGGVGALGVGEAAFSAFIGSHAARPSHVQSEANFYSCHVTHTLKNRETTLLKTRVAKFVQNS